MPMRFCGALVRHLHLASHRSPLALNCIPTASYLGSPGLTFKPSADFLYLSLVFNWPPSGEPYPSNWFFFSPRLPLMECCWLLPPWWCAINTAMCDSSWEYEMTHPCCWHYWVADNRHRQVCLQKGNWAYLMICFTSLCFCRCGIQSTDRRRSQRSCHQAKLHVYLVQIALSNTCYGKVLYFQIQTFAPFLI